MVDANRRVRGINEVKTCGDGDWQLKDGRCLEGSGGCGGGEGKRGLAGSPVNVCDQTWGLGGEGVGKLAG